MNLKRSLLLAIVLVFALFCIFYPSVAEKTIIFTIAGAFVLIGFFLLLLGSGYSTFDTVVVLLAMVVSLIVFIIKVIG